MAEPRAQGFLTRRETKSGKARRGQGSKGEQPYQLVFLGLETSPVSEQGSSPKSSSQLLLFLCCYPKCHPTAHHLLLVLRLAEDNRQLLLAVISEYTFLITEK